MNQVEFVDIQCALGTLGTSKNREDLNHRINVICEHADKSSVLSEVAHIVQDYLKQKEMGA